MNALDALDRIGYCLLGVAGPHERERVQFRALMAGIPYETYRIRLELACWTVGVVAGVIAGLLTVTTIEANSLTSAEAFPLPPEAMTLLGGALAGFLGVLVARSAVRFGARVLLDVLVARRRRAIEHTLPGAVRYLHVSASGTTDPIRLLGRVAENSRVHGPTARAFRRIRRRALLTGSVESAIRAEARDTPATDSLAPFLLGFLEARRRGKAALREFLDRESRLLAVEDEQAYHREKRYRRMVLGLFLLLLVGPVLLALGILGAGLFGPAWAPDPMELPVRMDGTVTAVGSIVVLALGGTAAVFAYLLRPSGHRWARPAPSQHLRTVFRTVAINPTNTVTVLLPIAGAAVTLGAVNDVESGRLLLGAYVGVAVPAGIVDLRRARRRAALDRALPDFVHDLGERLESGQPLSRAVTELASEVQYGPLDRPVRQLAADLTYGAGPNGGRKRALERFVGRIGTPFAGRTVGLAIGAIEAGAETRTAVAHLRAETGRLVHADRARRSRYPAVLLVGWSAALLIVAIVVMLNLMVLDAVGPAGPISGVTIEPEATNAGSRPLLYRLTQATMLASGWFAGLSGRGVFEALLHSGVLLTIAFLAFEFAGLL
ncbi:MAG: type II secretion system F family protein [Halodesulfurarchaeum sp.]